MVLPTLSDIVMIWYRHPSVTLFIIWYRYPTATSKTIWCCHSSVTSYIIQCCLLSLTSNIIHWHHTLDCPTNPQWHIAHHMVPHPEVPLCHTDWHCTSYDAAFLMTLYIIRCHHPSLTWYIILYRTLKCPYMSYSPVIPLFP